ncbi:MAG: cation transporter [Chloroflexota bacterium]
MTTAINISVEENKYWNWAVWLAFITIFYNLIEGIVSIALGYSDETLALFGFGVDSFIETISGLGILSMIYRIRRNDESKRSGFESVALRITGFCFYALAAGLAIGAVINIIENRNPESAFWGVVVSLISIGTMYALIRAKVKVGKRLNSAPIIADANCTKVCMYMSFAVLASSLAYELFHIQYIDSIGAAALVWFSFKEGRECFEKARKPEELCACDHCE